VARRRARTASRRQRAVPEPPKLARIASDVSDVSDVSDENAAASAFLGNISASLPAGSGGARAFADETNGTNDADPQRDPDDVEGSFARNDVVARGTGTSSTAQAMANSVNILLGVGLLSVPYALKQGGWAGLGVLGMLGLVTNYTGKALIRVQARGSLPDAKRADGARKPLSSYEDIGEAAFGANGRAFITWVLYTELLGTCALFFILEGDHLSALFDGTKYLSHSSQWWQCASAAVMIPTLWLADLSALSYVGALGAVASVSLVGVVASQLLSVDGFPATAAPPGLESTAMLHLATLPVSFGLLAFVFAGHAVFPAIYASMAGAGGVRADAGPDIPDRGRDVRVDRRRRVRHVRRRGQGRGDAQPPRRHRVHGGVGAHRRESPFQIRAHDGPRGARVGTDAFEF
jgi:hypothetical protein